MLKRLRDLVERSDSRGILEEGIRPFRLEPGSTFERAVAYVETGAGSELLMELAGRDTTTTAQCLDLHADLSPWQYRSAPQSVLSSIGSGWKIEKGSNARGALYVSELAPDQLARLGRLFAAVSPDVNRSSDRVPEWFAALLNDACTTNDLGTGYRRSPKPERRKRWSPEFLEQIARQGGVPADDVAPLVIGVLVDRPQMVSYMADPFAVLLHHWDVAAYLTAHADIVRALVPTAKATGKLAFLDYLRTRQTEREFFGDVIGRLVADTAKSVREKALALLNTIPEAQQVVVLEPLLATAPPSRLTAVVTHLVGISGGEATLRRAAEAEKPGARRRVLEDALARSDVLTVADGAEPIAIEIPPFEPIAEVELGEDFDRVAQAAVAAHLAATEAKLREVEGDGRPESWRRDSLKRIIKDLSAVTPAHIERTRAFLSGTGEYPGATSLDVLGMPAIKSKLPALSLLQEVRLVAPHPKNRNRFGWHQLREAADLDVDPRILADALQRAGAQNPDDLIREFIFDGWYFRGAVAPDNAWPYFAERPEGLEIVLGLRPSAGENTYGQAERVETALAILAAFPAIPQQFLSQVVGLALGEGKMHRRTAQRVLESHPGARTLGEQGLHDGKSDVRAAAAAWLARMGDADAVPAITQALAKERREVVRAAFLNALEVLGVDIHPYVAPDILRAEAAKGLKPKPPASLAWFPFDGLPSAHWAADGTVVPPEVIRWWVILAVKLKDPSGLGLIGRYLSLLADGDRARLGRFVLDAWVGHDTRHPSDEESRALADNEAQSRYDAVQRWYKQHPQYYEAEAAKTVEQHWQDLYRDHQSIYVGSAIADKGLLALTVGVPGADLARVAQAYFVGHQGRRAQAEALVTALAANGEPATIQVLLSVARRFKQATVQARAQELAQELADRRGWTAEQLADRTVATAGFDDDGILRLDLGSRVYTGRITAKFALELSNDAGKVVKALPAARQDDDPELVKAAKAQLATSRKELKQVVGLQTQRLYEAMCTGRTWPVADWREFVLGHPIMSRLAAGLVWVENPGEDQRAFRPGDGGALIDAEDEDVVLGDGSVVGLAHAVVLGAEQSESWRQHLVDYEVAALFGQFGAPAPVAAGRETEIVDHRGWLSDSFSIRGRATKLGYSRAQGEDGGWFTEYRKPYVSVGLTAVIGFTGAFLPEENIAAAVTSLTFEGATRTTRTVALADVPPVLLAETYRDYATVAAAGTYDPEWEKKSEW